MVKIGKSKKVLMIVLSVVLVIGLMPSTAFADTVDNTKGYIAYEGNLPSSGITVDDDVDTTTTSIKLSGKVDYAKAMTESSDEEKDLLENVFTSIIKQDGANYYSKDNNPLMGRYTVIGIPRSFFDEAYQAAEDAGNKDLYYDQQNADMLSLYRNLDTKDYTDPHMTDAGKVKSIADWGDVNNTDDLFGIVVGPTNDNIVLTLYAGNPSADDSEAVAKLTIDKSALTFDKVALAKTPAENIELAKASDAIADTNFEVSNVASYSGATDDDSQTSKAAVVTWNNGTKDVTVNDIKAEVKGLKGGESKTYKWSLSTKDAAYDTALNNLAKKEGTTKISVKIPATKKIHTAKKTVYVKKGKSVTLPVTAYDADGKTLKLTWKSNKKKVATVSQKGKVKAKKAGTAKITATAPDGKKITVTVKVTKKNVKAKKITIKGAPKKMKIGAVKYLTLKTKPTKAMGIVKWKSNKKKVVTVDKTGKIVAKKKGTAKITATFGGKKVTKKITVKK